MEEVRDILLKRLAKINKAYLNYQNNPYNPKTTHKLRVKIRKLRALLNFIKLIIDEDIYDKLNASLRETAQVFVKVREIDVLIELCGEIALEKPELSEGYKDLFNYLGKERRKEMRRTFNKTNKSLIENTLALCEKEILELEFNQDSWEDFAEKRMKKRIKKLEKRLEETDEKDYDYVHKTRITAKKVRYAAADFGSIMKKTHKKAHKKAEEIQDELGHQTDLHINQNLLTEFEKKTDENSLKQLFHKLKENLA